MHITRQTRVIVVTAAVLMLACDNSVMAACDPCGCPSCPTLGSGGPITGRISPLYTTETQCCQNPPDIAGLSGAARAEKWANRLHITISDVGDTDTLTRYAWNPNRGQNCACAQVAQTTETRGDTVAIEWSGDVDLAVPDHYTLKATLSNNTTATEHIACDDGTYMDCDVSVPDGSLELVSNVYVQWLKCSCTRLSNMESETSEPKSVFEDGWLYDQESSGVVTTQYKWEYVTGFTSPCGQQVQMGLQAQVGINFQLGITVPGFDKFNFATNATSAFRTTQDCGPNECYIPRLCVYQLREKIAFDYSYRTRYPFQEWGAWTEQSPVQTNTNWTTYVETTCCFSPNTSQNQGASLETCNKR